MKILKLKFKNINSLFGENEIDFTDPIFTSEGLFAITGKTGAGKSSILDAISLALYGRTPRIEISTNSNEVITRGEKDCYAEIIFEVNNKIWKSSWKHEYNKKGNLKPTQRIIADHENKIIADSVKTCNKMIADILGLEFEQFTKVVMLAQGSFAAFLQEKSAEKAALLEKITGTGIYAEISKNIFDKHKEEKAKLDRISIELQSIKILTNEEINQYYTEKMITEDEINQCYAKINEIEIASKWLLYLSDLQNQIYQSKQNVPHLKEKTNALQVALKNSENQFHELKNCLKNQEPIFNQTRELDVKISEKKGIYSHFLKEISEIHNQIIASENIIIQQENELNNSLKTLSDKQLWSDKHPEYQSLATHYIAIENESKTIETLNLENKELNEILNQLEIEINQLKKEYQNAHTTFNNIYQSLEEASKQLNLKENQYARLLNGKSLSDIESEKTAISNIGSQIKNLIEFEKSISNSQKLISNIDQQLIRIEESLTKFKNKNENDKQNSNQLESQIQLLEENIKLTNIIKSLEEHRLNLKDDEPCPLCGSTTHPFVNGHIPPLGVKEKELSQLKTSLQNILSSIQKNIETIATLSSDKTNHQKNKSNEELRLKENAEKKEILIDEIKKNYPEFIFPKGDDKIEILHQFINEKRKEYTQIVDLAKELHTINEEISKLRNKDIQELHDEKEKIEKLKNDVETKLKIKEQQHIDKKALLLQSKTNFDLKNNAFLDKLNLYSAKDIHSLKEQLNHWSKIQKQIEELTNHSAQLKLKLNSSEKDIDNLKTQYHLKQNETHKIEKEIQELSTQRIELFSNKSVEEEENKIKKQIEHFELEKSNNQKNYTESETRFVELNKSIAAKETELEIKIAENRTTQSIEEIQVEHSEIKTKLDTLLQKMGAIKQTLKSNEENQKMFGNKIREKENQLSIYEKWSKLNELAGSNDGKKFRNFAQSLTFEHLIQLSNRQLQNLSDRYILNMSKDNSTPFELSVIDKYHNGLERTAQNLSGGEKFIVSLSLALGLSKMASKNMRIDTMFIDEGFGTLDSDYLDIALNTLSNLQSEGKIIGIISHLTELKERIATHIEIVQIGNGHSKIMINS